MSSSSAPLTEPELRELVEELRLELDLGSWDVRLDLLEPPIGYEALAQIDRDTDSRVATIRLAPEWRTYPRDAWGNRHPEPARAVIAHELLHLVLNGIDTVIHSIAKPRLSPDAGEMLVDVYRHELELLVERLQRIVTARP